MVLIMVYVTRILHTEPGDLHAKKKKKKNIRRLYGYGCGYADEDAACGADYVCSCFMRCVCVEA